METYKRPHAVEKQLTELLGHKPDPLDMHIQGDSGTCPNCYRKDVHLNRQEPGDGSLYELCDICENREIDSFKPFDEEI